MQSHIWGKEQDNVKFGWGINGRSEGFQYMRTVLCKQRSMEGERKKRAMKGRQVTGVLVTKRTTLGMEDGKV